MDLWTTAAEEWRCLDNIMDYCVLYGRRRRRRRRRQLYTVAAVVCVCVCVCCARVCYIGESLPGGNNIKVTVYRALTNSTADPSQWVGTWDNVAVDRRLTVDAQGTQLCDTRRRCLVI
jgi:hypothetical protein